MTSKIKVLHLIKSFGRGGAEMLLPETLKLHNRDQFEFSYAYFLPWKNHMVPYLEEQGVEVMCFKANNNLQMLLKLNEVCQFVRQNKIDIIHSHLPWAGVVARLVGKLAGVAVIYTEHNKWERYHKGTYWLNKLTFHWQNIAVAVSVDVEESIRQHSNHKISSLKVSGSSTMRRIKSLNSIGQEMNPLVLQRNRSYLTTVLNGVNTEFFKRNVDSGKNVRQELGIPADAPVIGSVAVFRFQKRLDMWLDIAATILKELPETHFILVGQGPLLEEIEKKCAALGMDGRVHFAGLKTEVRPYLSAMDVYMMSSIFEGLPIALLEAMSCACAVISTDAGGVKEVIQHGKSGYLCSVDEPEKLSGYAVELIQNDVTRIELANGARARVKQDFSIRKMVNQLELLYLSLQHAN